MPQSVHPQRDTSKHLTLAQVATMPPASSPRIIFLEGQPWFIAFEIARALNMPDSRSVLRQLPRQHRKKHTVGKRRLNVIKLPGVRQALLLANQQQAKPVRAWLEQELKRCGLAARC